MQLMRFVEIVLMFGLVVAAVMVAGGLAIKYGKSKGAGGTTPALGETLLKVGLVGLSVILGLILLRVCYTEISETPNMPDRVYQIVRMTIGLAAGFVSAGLGGTIEVKGDIAKVTVKAGGPIGVAVFFYWANPMAFMT